MAAAALRFAAAVEEEGVAQPAAEGAVGSLFHTLMPCVTTWHYSHFTAALVNPSSEPTLHKRCPSSKCHFLTCF